MASASDPHLDDIGMDWVGKMRGGLRVRETVRESWTCCCFWRTSSYGWVNLVGCVRKETETEGMEREERRG